MDYGFASERHAQFPPMVVVSIVNVCNQRCVHCFYPTFAKLPDYHPNYMEWAIWTKLVDEMAAHPWSILNLGTDGEPLLHPRFVEMMRYAREKQVSPINLTTNGLLLKRELARTLVSENLLDVINISLDAHSPETYQRIRGGSFERVVRNVEDLLELRRQTGSPVKVQVNIIDQPEVADELRAFIEHWTPRVDNVLVRTYYDATSVVGGTGPNITGKQAAFPTVERWPCQQFWRRANVSDDGTIRFCVDDWFNKTHLGDLHETTLAAIWTGARYQELRRLQLAGAFEEISYCAKCTEWQGMKWDHDYFVAMEKMLGKKLL